jgi:hypothetical protein
MGESKRRRTAMGGDAMLSPEAVLRHLIERHREYYIVAGQPGADPVFLLFRKHGPPVVCAEPVLGNGSFEERERVVQALKGKVAELGDVCLYAFVYEAWMAPRASDLRPRDSDQRIEMLVTEVVHRDGRFLCRAVEMVRDWQSGKVVELKEIEGDRGISRYDLFEAVFHIPVGRHRDANGKVVPFESKADCAAAMRDLADKVWRHRAWVIIGPETTQRGNTATKEVLDSPRPKARGNRALSPTLGCEGTPDGQGEATGDAARDRRIRNGGSEAMMRAGRSIATPTRPRPGSKRPRGQHANRTWRGLRHHLDPQRRRRRVRHPVVRQRRT